MEPNPSGESAMAKFKTHFELGVGDLQLIEKGLRLRLSELARTVVDIENGDLRVRETDKSAKATQEITAIRDLMGRLHHQKIWYEPDDYAPRG